MNTFERIKDLCTKQQISISELERKLNFGNGIIRRWSTSAPNSDKLERVANYFNVSTDYLLGRTDNPFMNDSQEDTLAAHAADRNHKFTEEEIEDIKNYIDFIISKNNK
ncbi:MULTISPECIES: helix-turn-helix domain-containing protein [Listeria]|uniref:Helix-turn-helix transcriptional regulator n=1 Tax=Listeria booriae TaxID=1552123 RepID=A0A842B5D1_9LIST|nr:MULTISPECIES: helix-turn-helix transcriptional regulator [Listeria]MBC1292229.1 helix-turn-helix transcriptional regulator [Listeria booriae]MBC1502403.1 helix-turn-helix transcriptional regulator [Listeria booriae]MBC1566971.1 helix-turn-helix transcriptional regulator [Listeria booriae]MBC1747115.1 helix-turn-helix transcriptional regulator [Listeria seeligeri]MBC1797539.1 helix-turn-helix transcriptional regulator [Listeria booriae]